MRSSHETLSPTKQTTTVNEVLSDPRRSGHDAHSICYIYLVDDHATLIGVIDLREIILAADATLLGRSDDLAVVSAQRDDTREDLVEMFTRDQFHLIPVVDEHDRLLGVVHYRDIMKGPIARARGQPRMDPTSPGVEQIFLQSACFVEPAASLYE